MQSRPPLKPDVMTFSHPRTGMEVFLRLISLPARARDVAFNAIFSRLCGAQVNMVWSDVKLQGAANIKFGERFSSGRGLWLQTIENGRLEIGDKVNVSDWVHVGALDRVTIGNGCLLGSKVLITDHSHGPVDGFCHEMLDIRPDARPLISKGPVVLEDQVWLGDSVVVLPGVTIGRNTIVGANSVVNRSLPSDSIAAGVPARVIRPILSAAH